jgi:adenylate kinase
LNEVLHAHRASLDAVIALVADCQVLIDRMASRVAETLARGEAVRSTDDNPVAFGRRLAVYCAQTKPLTDYYRNRGLLRTADAMRPVEEVARKSSQCCPGIMNNRALTC